MTDPSPAEILAAVAVMRAELDRMERKALAMDPTLPASPPRQAAAPTVADDADLDSEWGNPTVRKDPPRWQGPSCAGLRYADCPPEFLDTLAGFLDWQAGKSDEKNEMASNGKPRSAYLRKDAGRCRGWAARIRAKAAPRRPVAPHGVTGRGSMADEEEPPPF